MNAATIRDALYEIRPLTGNLCALVEISTDVRVKLGTSKECLDYAERIGLQLIPP